MLKEKIEQIKSQITQKQTLINEYIEMVKDSKRTNAQMMKISESTKDLMLKEEIVKVIQLASNNIVEYTKEIDMHKADIKELQKKLKKLTSIDSEVSSLLGETEAPTEPTQATESTETTERVE